MKMEFNKKIDSLKESQTGVKLEMSENLRNLKKENQEESNRLN